MHTQNRCSYFNNLFIIKKKRSSYSRSQVTLHQNLSAPKRNGVKIPDINMAHTNTGLFMRECYFYRNGKPHTNLLFGRIYTLHNINPKIRRKKFRLTFPGSRRTSENIFIFTIGKCCTSTKYGGLDI